MIGSVIIFLGLLTLIVSFNKKLFKVIIASNNFNNKPDILLDLITKQTFLGSVMVINMIIFVLIVLVLTFLRKDKESMEWIIYEWILGLLCIINCLCIFFGFKMNEREYNKLCNICHKRLIALCKLLLILKNPNDESLMEHSLAKESISSDLLFEDGLFVHR